MFYPARITHEAETFDWAFSANSVDGRAKQTGDIAAHWGATGPVFNSGEHPADARRAVAGIAVPPHHGTDKCWKHPPGGKFGQHAQLSPPHQCDWAVRPVADNP